MMQKLDMQGSNELMFGAELLDGRVLQGLQDRFCACNNLYCVCLSQMQGVVTKAYGSKEELNYIHEKVGMARHIVLLNRLITSEMEDVVEEPLEEDYLKMNGVAIRVGGKIAAIWIVIGVLSDIAAPEQEIPENIQKTTTKQYYNSLDFLTYISKQYFATKLDELLAQEAFAKNRESQEQIKTELQRTEVMTSIVKMLESENGFSKIADEILTDVCNYLKISNAALIRINRDGETADMISECCLEEEDALIAKCQGISTSEFPFTNGKPYMISADSILPPAFAQFFEKWNIQAAISLPVEINGEAAMYLCFFELRKRRIWDVSDIKFLNEVKQIVQSILIKRITKNSLASSYASLEAILENVGCGICVRDMLSEKILYTNQQFHRLFADDRFEKQQDEIFRSGNKRYGNGNFVEYYSKEDNRYFDIYHTQINWVDGRMVMLLTVYDVTDKKLYQQKIERQANNDFLTGLYNRMRCEHDVEIYIQKAREQGGKGALCYIDLDDFKHINDGLGHQYGDILLQTISRSLRGVTGLESTCYRMGGDEFIIIVNQEEYQRLDEILTEIRNIFSKPWFLKGGDYYCTMSMGVVCFPDDGDNVQELIKKADIALYEAKKDGKNRIEFYDENVEATSFKRLDLEKNMRYATTNSCQEFEVYYQPIVDISRPGDPCSGAEALIRWNSEAMGMISPSEFIPLAEYLGLINPIGSFVLKEACRRCKYWNDMGHPEYHVNVNLSVVQLLQNDMKEKVREVLEETKMDPANLTLEVTESLAINDMKRMKKILSDIKSLGVKVALDDFGTGYSSLNHIRELPIDIIKIDRCFIIDIGKDEYSEAFVKMVSELAETIGVRICVEGVEETEQVEKLRSMKVQYIQGYYYGKPMRAEDFEKKYL